MVFLWTDLKTNAAAAPWKCSSWTDEDDKPDHNVSDQRLVDILLLRHRVYSDSSMLENGVIYFVTIKFQTNNTSAKQQKRLVTTFFISWRVVGEYYFVTCQAL